jgi:hypothetical protein
MKLPWRRRDREDELDREIQDHLDLEEEEQEAAGLTAGEARRAARRVFGNPAIVREDVREAWGWQWLERLQLDTRLAVRLWARSPGFSAIAIATLGLGIGAATVMPEGFFGLDPAVSPDIVVPNGAVEVAAANIPTFSEAPVTALAAEARRSVRLSATTPTIVKFGLKLAQSLAPPDRRRTLHPDTDEPAYRCSRVSG